MAVDESGVQPESKLADQAESLTPEQIEQQVALFGTETLTRHTKVSNRRVKEAYSDYGAHLHEMQATR